MGIECDPSTVAAQYAHPHKLVTSAWLGAKLGTPGLAVVESDADFLLYDIGHIPTAVRISFGRDLTDPIRRDLIDGRRFAQLMDSKGIRREDTVVIYGDRSNLWAAFTLWVFELFGHPDVRLLDGGRDAWMLEERETSYAVPTAATTGYPVVEADGSRLRILADELRASYRDLQLMDLRDPADFGGQAQGATDTHRRADGRFSRTGHLPGSVNVALETSIYPSGRFQTFEELTQAYAKLDSTRPSVAYCDDGSRAAHLWFVLRYLLGWEDIRIYDGSWIEWGNMIGVPIEVSEPATR